MYLKFKFHDNDFSFPIQDALECFWEYVKDNNGKYWSNKNALHPAMPFQQLNEVGQLLPLLIRTCTLHTLLREVETATRNLKEEGVSKYFVEDWMKEILPLQDTYSKYFSEATIEFVKDGDFTWNNGEDCWLNLWTGEATLA